MSVRKALQSRPSSKLRTMIADELLNWTWNIDPGTSRLEVEDGGKGGRCRLADGGWLLELGNYDNESRILFPKGLTVFLLSGTTVPKPAEVDIEKRFICLPSSACYKKKYLVDVIIWTLELFWELCKKYVHCTTGTVPEAFMKIQSALWGSIAILRHHLYGSILQRSQYCLFCIY